MSETPFGDSRLVAFCGLYCGECRAFKRKRCPGCADNAKATWCAVRKCCLDEKRESCAVCLDHLNPRTCGKFHNWISRFFGFVFRSDRAACVRRLREIGRSAFAMEMCQDERHSMKRKWGRYKMTDGTDKNQWKMIEDSSKFWYRDVLVTKKIDDALIRELLIDAFDLDENSILVRSEQCESYEDDDSNIHCFCITCAMRGSVSLRLEIHGNTMSEEFAVLCLIRSLMKFGISSYIDKDNFDDFYHIDESGNLVIATAIYDEDGTDETCHFQNTRPYTLQWVESDCIQRSRVSAESRAWEKMPRKPGESLEEHANRVGKWRGKWMNNLLIDD